MSDLDKLREKAQAAPRKNWRLRKSFHGPKYAWVSWGDEAEGLGTADLDVPAARYIAAADPTTILALIDRLQRVETALQDICSEGCTIGGEAGDCREEWPVEGDDWYDDSWCEACVARAALEGGSE